MKKLLILVLAALMIFNMAACSKNTEEGNSKGTSAVNTVGKDQSTQPESGVLTVCSSNASPFLKQAAGRYHELHPGITVEVKEYLPIQVEKSGNTYVSRKPTDDAIEKYVNTVNTELMGGKGPDIILLDNTLSYSKYIDKNLFVDMNKLMQADKDFNSDKYYTSIFKAMEYKKGLYTMPMEFYFPMIASVKDMSAYSNDNTWTFNDFFTASQKAVDESQGNKKLKYISEASDNDIFNLLFENSFNKIVNMEKRTAQFTSDSFINLLKQCKAASDKNLLGKASNSVKSLKMDSMSSLHSFNLIISAALMKAAVTKSPDNDKTFLCRLPTIDGKKSVAFNCVNLYAINKNSKNTKMAWNFIKFLLSEEMQASAGTAFPVEKEAFKKKEKESFKLYNKNLSEKDITELVDKYHNDIVNIISDINTYSYIDPKINKIVEEEIKPFFTGQKSAEDTAAAIQNKVNIYLNE